jgi:hypothetical protein
MYTLKKLKTKSNFKIEKKNFSQKYHQAPTFKCNDSSATAGT